jgi:hypothetical protein
MTIVASITNISGVGIPFQPATGPATAIEAGATATLTLADSYAQQLAAMRDALRITYTYTQLSDQAPKPFIVGRTEVPGTTYTVLPSDNGCIIECTNAAGCVVTLPATSARGMNIGIMRYGAGAVTWTAGSGATIRVAGAFTGIAAQYGTMSAYVRENVAGTAAEWIIGGNVS